MPLGRWPRVLSFAVPLVAAAIAGEAHAQAGPLSQTFRFVATADHDERRVEKQSFCLNPWMRVTSWTVQEKMRSGAETGIQQIVTEEARPNCITLIAVIQGRGVRKIGNLIVDRVGRGGLELEINVVGTLVTSGMPAPRVRPSPPAGSTSQLAPFPRFPRGATDGAASLPSGTRIYEQGQSMRGVKP